MGTTNMPELTVEIAFDSGYSTPAASRTWTDVTTYVEFEHGVSISRGREDEFSEVQPSRLTVTLDNRDGRFTPGYTGGAHYPDVKKGRPIRVSATWPAAGTVYRRFTGYIDEWPVAWPDAGAALSTVTVTASSRMARLGRNAALENILTTEILADDPVAYFPLGEPDDSTSVASIAVTPQTQLLVKSIGSAGSVTFASATGPPTDGLSSPTFATTDINKGQYLGGTHDTTLSQDFTALEAFFTVSGNPSVFAAIGDEQWIAVGTDVSGNAVGYVRNAGSDNNSATLSGPAVDDGAVHQAVFRFNKSGGFYDIALLVDGVEVDATASAFISSSSITAMLAAGANLLVGRSPSPSERLFGDFTVSHVTLYNTAAEIPDSRFLTHYQAATTGFEGDSSDEWIDLLASYAGIPSAEVSTETGATTSVAFADITGKAPVAAMQDIARTEGGLVFDAADGTLTFHARTHRYNAVSAYSLSATTQQIERDLEPKLDDQGLVNDVTATTPSGVAYRAVDQSSVDDHGVYGEQVTLLTTSALELADYVDFRLALYAEPQVRVPNASVQMVAQPSATVTAMLDTELGDLVTLTGLPTQAPASSMEFFVEGWTEVATTESYLMTMNLSPAFATQDVWVVEDAVFGQYDAYGLSY